MIFALCSLSRGIRYPRYTWILRIRRCPLAAGELPNLQALCFDKYTTSAGDAWVPLNRQKEKRKTMNTPIPDVEILPPEAPSATTVADPPPSDSRCLHRYHNGTQCRLRGSESQSGLCSRHFRLNAAALPSAPNDSVDFSGYLLRDLSKFSSAEDLGEFLTGLLLQATKGRVSPRRAAVLAYITNQLLHSRCVVEKELDKESDKEPQIIFDLPRPKRD